MSTAVWAIIGIVSAFVAGWIFATTKFMLMHGMPRRRLVGRAVERLPKGSCTPAYLADLIRSQAGEDFKACWGSGAWDTYSSEGEADLVYVNTGNGFEDGIEVPSEAGIIYYVGPFRVETMPDAATMLLFRCSRAVFIRAAGPRLLDESETREDCS